MKKIVLLVLFFITSFFLLPPSVYALPNCQFVPRAKISSCTKVKCDVESTWYCCDTQPDCDGLKAGQALCAGDPTGINTAIGCIHVLSSQEGFLADILKWAVGIGSGIAFLLCIYAGFMIMTSVGSPERLKAGQELLTSAISGLILIIFSIFILKFIGVDILGLSKFGLGP